MARIRSWHVLWVTAGLAALLAGIASPAPGSERPSRSAPKELPKIPAPHPEAANVPEGFMVEVAAHTLTYPSSIEFDDRGNFIVSEAGFNYGDTVGAARLLLYPADGGPAQEIASQLSAPITDLLWHEGRLYISHRGKISVLENDGAVRDLVTDLPSLGDHHNNGLAVGPDGKIYFGQGTATNSGVVGVDNFQMGWLAKYPEFHDRPALDVPLRPVAFPSPNPIATLAPGQQPVEVETSPFAPFGQVLPEQTIVRGTVKSNGTILRMNPDGSELEVFAWGLRNPFGLAFGPDGKLYATDAGYDERGSRPIANAPDCLWVVKEGAWYGFPDFVAGEPVTDPKFRSPRGPAPQFLMAEHPPAEKPLLTLPPHTGGAKFAFSPGGKFGEGQVYVGLIGDMLPVTGEPTEHPGYKVIRLDAKTLEFAPFFAAMPDALGPPGLEYVVTSGPKRPVDVAFSPDGRSLYVVDVGAMAIVSTAAGPAPHPFPGTGAVWRITPGQAGRALRPERE